jgi:hypothetical protein
MVLANPTKERDLVFTDIHIHATHTVVLAPMPDAVSISAPDAVK